jgi:hypothetical protein
MDFDRLMQVLPKDPIRWDIEDVQGWLDFIGLSQLKQNFSK